MAKNTASGASGNASISTKQGKPPNSSRRGFTGQYSPLNPRLFASPIAISASRPPTKAIWRGDKSRSKFCRCFGVMPPMALGSTALQYASEFQRCRPKSVLTGCRAKAAEWAFLPLAPYRRISAPYHPQPCSAALSNRL